MANKSLFKSQSAITTPAVADTTNRAGGKAFAFEPKHCLAQIAATNCFNGTYYADADANLKLAKDAVDALRSDPEFIAKVAVYSRDKGYMKDMPAYLCAVLATLDTKLFRKVFRKVIDNGKMLRNVIQIARSGQAGRTVNITSSAFRGAVQEFFDTKSPYALFRASVGNDPSFRDILRMARPKPNTKEKEVLFAYLNDAEFDKNERVFRIYGYDKFNPRLSRAANVAQGAQRVLKKVHSFDDLPEIVRQYEQFKATGEGEVPNVDFRLLDSFMKEHHWLGVARNAGWTMTRMNLNTFGRHGVFNNSEVTNLIANRLKDREEVLKAKAFPYQLLMAFKAADANVPHVVREALQDAMEIAVDNVPEFGGQVYVAVDVSGSMSSSVTGYRAGGVSSAVRCVDVASLFGAAVLRKNRSAKILPFDTRIHTAELNGRDTVMTNADKLSKFGGGGTDCGLAIEHLNKQGAKGDAIIFVSDCESWVDGSYYGNSTKMLAEWEKFSARNKKAKLVCIDLTPRDNSQVKQARPNILQVGGFSDQVFEVVNSFLNHGHETDHWVSMIESTSLD